MRWKFLIRNFIVVTLPVFLVAVLFSLTAIFITMETSRRTVETINEQTVSRIKESTELIFSEADAQSLNYSLSPFVMLRLEDLLRSGYSDKEYLDISYMIKSFLDSNVNSKSFLHSIYIYLENDRKNFFASSIGLANVLNSRDTAWIEKTYLASPGTKQWLELREVGIYAVSNHLTNVITLYKRLYSSNRPAPAGVVVVNIQQDYLKSFYRSHLTYPGQSIILLNDDGTLLCKAGALEKESKFPDIDALRKNYFSSQQANSAYGLTYLSLIPRNTPGVQAGAMIRFVIAAAILILFLGGVFACSVTRGNTRDVEYIIRLIDSAEKGEELPVSRSSRNIYGYITQNIIKTYLEKNQLDRQLIEEKYILESLRFSLLQSQLNPHFLFNTLKNIFWRAVKLTGGCNDVSRMIDLLSSVLHYALVNRDRYVLVEEEIENTRKYIEIQQIRFDYSFRVDWSCEGDISNARCIKFILQPLIENGITHGIRDIKNGIITVSIKPDRDGLCFSVNDNGRGFTPECIEAITRQFSLDNSPVKNIGLYNLNKRLILAYGPEAALEIQSTPGLETSVRFTVPSYPTPQDGKSTASP
jgi:two-component system sensor histidine kinase YesM